MASKKRKGERPDGLIQVTMVVGHNPDGTRKRKSFYGHTRTEAEAKRNAYKQHLQGGSAYSPDITVAEWVEIYKRTYRSNVNPAYLRANDRPYDRLSADIGYIRMRDVTEVMLQNALNRVSNMSSSTAQKYRAAIKRVFDRARKNRIIASSPADDLMLPPSTKGTHRALASWETKLILEHWRDRLPVGMWVMIMLLAGLRRGELVALEWDAIDLDKRVLSVRRTAVSIGGQRIIEDRAKSKAGIRDIQICDPLYMVLSSVPEERRHGPVCIHDDGKPASAEHVHYEIKVFCRLLDSIAKEQNIPECSGFSFRAHDLRHTFCTMLYDSGVDVKTAARLMGHANTDVTMGIYTHLSEEKRSASETLMLSYLNALGSPK